jgi:ADP-ribose pyrophosphatase YjhB (NUDIX family)
MMEKFTKVKKTQEKQSQQEDDNIKYKGKFITLVNEDGWEYTIENDCVVCLVYIKDEGYILMRSEPVPPWSYKYKNNVQKLSGHFLTPVSGTIEEGETPQACLRRELYEEAGIVLSEFKQLDIEGPYFQNKGGSAQYYLCLLELNYNEYKMVTAPGDGSKTEKLARTVKISLGDKTE